MPDPGFVQSIDRLMALELSTAEAAAMLSAIRYVNDKAELWPSLENWSRRAHLTQRGLRKILRGLEDRGVIVRVKPSTGGPRKGTNCYVIPALLVTSPTTSTPEPCSPVPPERHSGVPRNGVPPHPGTPFPPTPEPCSPVPRNRSDTTPEHRSSNQPVISQGISQGIERDRLFIPPTPKRDPFDPEAQPWDRWDRWPEFERELGPLTPKRDIYHGLFHAELDGMLQDLARRNDLDPAIHGDPQTLMLAVIADARSKQTSFSTPIGFRKWTLSVTDRCIANRCKPGEWRQEVVSDVPALPDTQGIIQKVMARKQAAIASGAKR